MRENGKYPKKNREIDLFDVTSFFGLYFFKISGLLKHKTKNVSHPLFFYPDNLTTIIYFIGATLDLQWMTAINQNHEKCTTEQIWWSSYVDSYLQQ